MTVACAQSKNINMNIHSQNNQPTHPPASESGLKKNIEGQKMGGFG